MNRAEITDWMNEWMNVKKKVGGEDKIKRKDAENLEESIFL